MKTMVRFSLVLFAFGLLAACSTTSTTPGTAPTAMPGATTRAPERALTSVPPSPVATEAPGGVSTAIPIATAPGAQVPSSCSAIASLVGAYMGGVATTKSLGAAPHLSCEFANANASTIVVVNIGVGGTATAFDALRAASARGGRTVTPIGGLGISAFSVSKNSVPGGVSALTAQGLVYVVESNLQIAQDTALIEQLMNLP